MQINCARQLTVCLLLPALIIIIFLTGCGRFTDEDNPMAAVSNSTKINITTSTTAYPSSSVQLFWKTDNNRNIGVYNIYRETYKIQSDGTIKNYAAFRMIAQSGAGGSPENGSSFSFVDTEVQAGFTNCYRIQPQHISGAVFPISNVICSPAL